MPKVPTQLQITKHRLRLLRHVEKVPRFRTARQTKALIDAIQYGDSDLAMWLLKRGFNPHGRDGKGRSVLWWAATLCRSNVIRELIRRGAKLPDDVLMGPVDAGDEKIVRLLVERGANVNCVAHQYSPVGHLNFRRVLLHVALCAVDEPRLQSIPILLIRAGAKVNRPMLPTDSPYARIGHNRSMLGLAAYGGQIRTVKAMIAAGANVNIRDAWQRTPLFDAAERGQLAAVKELLRAGARTNVKDRDGLTPANIVRNHEKSFEMFLTELHSVKASEAEQRARGTAWNRQRARMIALLEQSSPTT
jgi:ankyrin repeat protein